MTNRSYRQTLLAAGLLLATGPAFAASDAGPEPYSAPTPTMKPQKQEPLIMKSAPTTMSLGDGDAVQGPAAGPEPYSAADPVYPAASK